MFTRIAIIATVLAGSTYAQNQTTQIDLSSTALSSTVLATPIPLPTTIQTVTGSANNATNATTTTSTVEQPSGAPRGSGNSTTIRVTPTPSAPGNSSTPDGARRTGGASANAGMSGFVGIAAVAVGALCFL